MNSVGISVKNLIRDVTKIEGKKRQVNIAQTSEIVKITLELLGKKFLSEKEHQNVLRTLNKYGRRL
jgi:hypothetical protein